MQPGCAGLLLQLRPALPDQLLELRNRRRRSAILIAPVRKRYGFRAAAQFQRPVQRGISPAQNQQPLAGKARGVPDPVVQLPAFDRFGPVQAQLAGLERTHAPGEKQRSRLEPRASAGFDVEALPFPERLNCRDFLAQVKLGAEGFDLFQQRVHQFLRAEHRNGRNVVDRLVRVEFGALASGLAQRIHDVSVDAQQPQLEYLEESAGTGAHNQCIGLYCHCSVLFRTIPRRKWPRAEL